MAGSTCRGPCRRSAPSNRRWSGRWRGSVALSRQRTSLIRAHRWTGWVWLAKKHQDRRRLRVRSTSSEHRAQQGEQSIGWRRGHRSQREVVEDGHGRNGSLADMLPRADSLVLWPVERNAQQSDRIETREDLESQSEKVGSLTGRPAARRNCRGRHERARATGSAKVTASFRAERRARPVRTARSVAACPVAVSTAVTRRLGQIGTRSLQPNSSSERGFAG